MAAGKGGAEGGGLNAAGGAGFLRLSLDPRLGDKLAVVMLPGVEAGQKPHGPCPCDPPHHSRIDHPIPEQSSPVPEVALPVLAQPLADPGRAVAHEVAADD